MARHQIDMSGLDEKDFLVNFRRGEQYHCTLHNRTNQTLTVTATNMPVGTTAQVAAAQFAQPAGGALVITAGNIGQLDEPYVALRLSLAAAASNGSTIDIAEAG